MKNIRLVLTRCFQALVLIITLMPLTTMPVTTQPASPADMFNISEDELNQIVEALNDLSPDQLKELEDLGRATEERMKSQNLDPNKQSDWKKFMENEGMMQPQPQREPRPRPRPKPRPQRMKPMQPVKPIPVAVTSQADTKVMIDELINHLESLKQKAITRTAITKRLGTIQNQVDQFDLYLNLVRSPDIITLLSSKEFERLHGTLDQLHKNFVSLEPSISARERSLILNEDDPYEVLDLPYSATPEEIEARFTDLASERSPEAIKAQLDAEGCEAKPCKRMVKLAERTFRLIKRSYEQLKDPEKRAKLDATLTDKITRETTKEQISMRAFDQLFTAMNKAFTTDRVVGQLKQLLEKHKPQELEQAKLQQQREKEAFERSKRRVIVPQIKPRMKGRQKGPYDSFYRKMGQKRYGRPGGPRRQPGRRGRPQRRPQPKGKAAAPDKGGKPSDKPSAKKDDKKKDDKKDKKKAEVKPAKKQATKEDMKVANEMEDIAKILSDAKDKKYKIKQEYKTRAGETVEDEYELSKIMDDVVLELTLPADRNPSSIKQLKQFHDDYKLKSLRDKLKKIAPGPGKKLNDVLKAEWKDSGAKFGKVIKDLNELIYKQIDPRSLHEYTSPRQTVDNAKEKHYGLDVERIADKKLWKKKKDDEEEEEEERPKPPSGIDLGEMRDTLYGIKKYYDNINDAAK